MGLDIALTHALNELAVDSPAVRTLAVFCAEPLVWLMLFWYVFAFVVLKRGWVREFLGVAFGAAMVYLTNTAISTWWYRPRPFAGGVTQALTYVTRGSKSFPSDHASIAFFFAFLLAAHKPRWWWAYLIAGLVALGRVVAGVHYLSDALAGVVVGVGFGYLTIGLEKLFTTMAARK